MLLSFFSSTIAKRNRESRNSKAKKDFWKRKPRCDDLCLLQDNAPINTNSQSSSAITTSGLNLLAHFLDFFLFRHLKKCLRSIHFDSKEKLMGKGNEVFHLNLQFFYRCFHNLFIAGENAVKLMAVNVRH